MKAEGSRIQKAGYSNLMTRDGREEEEAFVVKRPMNVEKIQKSICNFERASDKEGG